MIVHVTVKVSALPTLTVGLRTFSANTLSDPEVALVLFISMEPLMVVPVDFRLVNANDGEVTVIWLYVDVPAAVPITGPPSFAVPVKIRPSAELALVPPIYDSVAESEPLRVTVPEPFMRPTTLKPLNPVEPRLVIPLQTLLPFVFMTWPCVPNRTCSAKLIP